MVILDEELDDSGEEHSGEHTIKTYEKNMVAADDENLDSIERNPVRQEAPEKKRKTVVAPHKKSKKVRSHKQALSETGSGLKALEWKMNKKGKKGAWPFAMNHRNTENMSFI